MAESGLQRAPGLDQVEKQISAGARNTLADMIRTYQQVMGATSQEAEDWVIRQVAHVSTLRRKREAGAES